MSEREARNVSFNGDGGIGVLVFVAPSVKSDKVLESLFLFDNHLLRGYFSYFFFFAAESS